MKRVAIVGAGPAGMSAAVMLAEHGVEVVVLERECTPGGLRSPDAWGGFRHHFGLYPFSTRNSLLEGLLKSFLADDLISQRPVRSLFSHARFVDNTTSLRAIASMLGAERFALGMAGFLLSRRLQGRSPASMAEWSGLAVGPWIHEALLDPLIRKIWGLSGGGLAPPEQAVVWPRPKTLQASFSTVLGAILPNRWGVEVGQPCFFPRKGWGYLADLMRHRLEKKGGVVHCDTPVHGVQLSNGRFASILPAHGPAIEADAVIFTNPMPEWAEWLTPNGAASPASGLHYRHLLLVGVTLKSEVPLMRFHTVDIADPTLPAVSAHCPNTWLPAGEAPPQLVLETYLAAHDPLWLAPQEEVVRQMLEGGEKLGLWKASDVVSSHVVRVANSAPVHGHGYENLRAGAMLLADAVPNIAVSGRGLFLHQGVGGNLEGGFRSALQTLVALGLQPAAF